MREVNFSIPNVNKASVGITTALYDRRALDCTSTLPLINSLNHLAYLTTSSARIRDILTVDGGIERLVCILKQGRSKDMMDMWKWNLAFQCVVNIGVRGTEAVRTRVVEADMVPVIATILDNYIKVIEKCRDKQEMEKHSSGSGHHHHRHHRHHETRSNRSSSLTTRSSTRIPDIDNRTFRRQNAPPHINVSATFTPGQQQNIAGAADHVGAPDATPAAPQFSITSPPERPAFPAHRRHHRDDNQQPSPSASRPAVQPLVPARQVPLSVRSHEVPIVERLTMIGPYSQPMPISSQPASPTTPLPPATMRGNPTLGQASRRRRPSIRHQNSAESDDMNGDSMQSDEAPDTEMSGTGDMQTTVGIQDISMDDGDAMIATTALDMAGPTASETQDGTNFGINHNTQLGNTTPTPVTNLGLSPNRPTIAAPVPPTLPSGGVPRYLLDRHVIPSPQMIAAMPREEDVLMSLQLLAYVSKYCNLRSYFQKSHLVPRLKIGKELNLLDLDKDTPESPAGMDQDEELEEEYLLPNDFNIFPLVEKFTVRYHSTDMQYWAGVVMRNLCRKDDTRGGIRQCAYYQCGKWEQYTRQFAKCRRCRRTKYCSKECQKSAWAFHRHWCVAASS
ncbi:MYND-type zinc finger protein samB [Zalerion maritima]|uniref:MYND-type zinc finger protein samB n=1 Tax=Zalerion maritima TaxID=339359 RepID=A0AAD5RXS8_9PEZI|nr:MYND-type zinc finger protein samB [Zalerion maritima]